MWDKGLPLGFGHVGSNRERHRQARAKPPRSLELTQLVKRDQVAVHAVNASDPDGRKLEHLRRIEVELLLVRERRHRRFDETDRSPLAKFTGRHTRDVAHDLSVLGKRPRTRDARDVERALRDQRGVEIHELDEDGATTSGLLDQLSMDRASLEGVVEQTPTNHPLVRSLIGRLGTNAGEYVVPGKGVEQVCAAGVERAHQRVDVRVRNARHQRCTLQVDYLGCASRGPQLGIRTDREDRTRTKRDCGGMRVGGVERANLGVDQNGLDGLMHAWVVARRETSTSRDLGVARRYPVLIRQSTPQRWREWLGMLRPCLTLFIVESCSF